MLTEGIIQQRLDGRYSSNCKYKCANIFLFASDWESDFFVQKQNGYCYEFEIKISKQDFLADFKKEKKHSILKNGFYADGENEYPHLLRPNKFYYVVPKDLISVEEVPSYAGLIYVEPYSFIIVKEAPFIHKEKLELRLLLCTKFYNRWLSAKYENRLLKNEIQKLKNLVV